MQQRPAGSGRSGARGRGLLAGAPGDPELLQREVFGGLQDEEVAGSEGCPELFVTASPGKILPKIGRFPRGGQIEPKEMIPDPVQSAVESWVRDFVGIL